jgi:hypothetical protein
MKQYTSFRKIQGEEIKVKSKELVVYNQKLDVQKSAKQKLIDINKDIAEKRKELLDVKTELTINEKKRNDLSKLIIDRSQFLTCKEMVIFIKDKVMPVRREGGVRGLKMSIEINLITGEQRNWVYKIYDDYNSSSDYVEKYSDILFDPSEEDVTERIKARIKSGNFSIAQISSTDDKYLDADRIDLKRRDILERQMTEYNKIESEIVKSKEKLEDLSMRMGENIKWKKQEA